MNSTIASARALEHAHEPDAPVGIAAVEVVARTISPAQRVSSVSVPGM